MSASRDLFTVFAISKPRALPIDLEQSFAFTPMMLAQVTTGTVDKPSSHCASASSHSVPRHCTYVAIMVALVAFDGVVQTFCVSFIAMVVVIVVVTAHDVASSWTGMAAMFVPEPHAVHMISETSEESETLPEPW